MTAYKYIAIYIICFANWTFQVIRGCSVRLCLTHSFTLNYFILIQWIITLFISIWCAIWISLKKLINRNVLTVKFVPKFFNVQKIKKQIIRHQAAVNSKFCFYLQWPKVSLWNKSWPKVTLSMKKLAQSHPPGIGPKYPSDKKKNWPKGSLKELAQRNHSQIGIDNGRGTYRMY